jgi:hypothetical protein
VTLATAGLALPRHTTLILPFLIATAALPGSDSFAFVRSEE